MTEYDAEFLEKLKKLCLEYDLKAGFYPDSSLEGFALYYFALHPEYKFCSYGGSIDFEFKEGGAEYRKELGKLMGEKDEEKPEKDDYDVSLEADEKGNLTNVDISFP
jgi:hypothetical protein